jgi:2,3-dimethylmalate lyase
MATRASELRAAIAEDGCLIVPGIHDGLTALLAEQAGFRVALVGGNATTASILGLPDLGFLSSHALVNHVRNLCHVLRIPLIVDADTGFGGPLQVFRTIRELEQAGAAAIQIEDQVPAKKCGLLEAGHPLISTDEMVEKIHAALAARENSDTLIIARTLAFSSGGLNTAIERGHAYREAGADAIFLQIPGTAKELTTVRNSIEGPLVLNVDESLPASEHGLEGVARCGYKLALFPGTIRYAIVKAVRGVLATLERDGTTKDVREQMATLDDYHRVLRMNDFLELERHWTEGKHGLP